MKKVVVAVDGPAGSGKSSVAKQVAVKAGLKYIDSGAIYRTVTFYLLNKEGSLVKGVDYSEKIDGLEITQSFHHDSTSSTFLNGKDVSEDIRNEVIAANIGIVSDCVGIREFVTNLLRSWAANESIIMDGRDIGTVVFPDADIKIYLDASVDERADRRYKEYLEKGKKVDLNEIRNQIIQRDNQDKSRAVGALKQAKDAIYIDSSSMTRDEVIDKFVSIIQSR